MSNTFFKFKKFTIHQDRCAMKVTTDACLFGAMVASKYVNASTLKILDIGTGTGLLALMFAQKNSTATIDAVEIDTYAATQARENISISLWQNNIQVFETDLMHFHPPYKYDIIICNPPFHENQLQSKHTQKNIAHHSSYLSINNLMEQSKSLLKESGQLHILLPYYRTQEAIEIANNHQLHCKEIIYVKDSIHKDYLRSMLTFQLNKNDNVEKEEIIIKQENGTYSSQFITLLKDYYLYID